MMRAPAAAALALGLIKMLPSTLASSKVVGGDLAVPGAYPFFVDCDGCGGTLIHEDIVMSAAHCDGKWGSVFVGSYTKGSTAHGAEQRRVVDKSVHPDFDSAGWRSDVMVVKIDRPSNFTPILLNSNDTLLSAGDELVVIGHGCTVGNSSRCTGYPDDLHEANVTYYPYDVCDEILYPLCGGDYIYKDVTLCAGTKEGGVDHCESDSGGPIMKQMDDGTYVQVGVTSWKYACGAPDIPSVYTRVSGVKAWIDTQICALSENPPADCPPTPAPTVPVNPEFPEFSEFPEFLEFPWG